MNLSVSSRPGIELIPPGRVVESDGQYPKITLNGIEVTAPVSVHAKGRHVFKVEAWDVSGNVSVEERVFWIE